MKHFAELSSGLSFSPSESCCRVVLNRWSKNRRKIAVFLYFNLSLVLMNLTNPGALDVLWSVARIVKR